MCIDDKIIETTYYDTQGNLITKEEYFKLHK